MAHAQTAPDLIASHDEGQSKVIGTVVVNGLAPSSLPSQIPTTMEGISGKQIETTHNASDSEDALKYFPSLVVRKRYIGDYNHAVLSSRASGTGNSARSAVYADGILLSNYLGNGATYAPRWGMVTPEEIERVDVMYGPFSAAYRGNSVGAVINYVTRMPKKFEAHAKFGLQQQPFQLYNSKQTYQGNQASFSLGNKQGDWSWWANVNRLDSHGQPMVFANRSPVQSAAAADATIVTGAVETLDKNNAPWLIIGTSTSYQTLQEHGKIKLAYDISPSLRLAYTLGVWRNNSQGRPESYLKNVSSGQTVYSGPVSINGHAYSLTPGDFSASNEELQHTMHGLSLKSHSKGVFDWEIAASQYHYDQDQLRSSGTPLPAAITPATAGSGSLQDQGGTGWRALAIKGIWRPSGMQGAHIVDFGWQSESYQLHISKTTLANNWISETTGKLANEVGGKNINQALYLQDRWAIAPDWLMVAGVRLEHWQAQDGYTNFSASKQINYAKRDESFTSPKLAISYQLNRDTIIKASSARAIRFPTVAELYGATSSVNSQYINDPNLRPEKSWTSELSIEKDTGDMLLRATLFSEDVRDSLYSQTTYDSRINANISRVQNIARIKTHGLELAVNAQHFLHKDLDIQASLTYTDSRIKENAGFVQVPGDTIGKYQPRVPVWRASTLASYRITPKLLASLGLRYSGRQYGSLNNADSNGFTYQGVSKYITADLRLHYQINKQWSAAFGVDNLNNYQYWNFHPYPQRSYSAELKFDL